MIQPLRTVHRRAVIALAVILPALLIAGLWGRRPQTTSRERASGPPPSALLLRKSDSLWQRHKIQTMFYGDAADPNTLYIVLRPLQALNKPDLLVYWSTNVPAENVLPPDARLLTSFAPHRTFPLHLDRQRSGALVLYSGAHQAIVDIAAVEKLP